MSSTNDLADKLRERQAIYRAAWSADISRLVRQHGEASVREALQLIEQRERRDSWDQREHAKPIQRGIERVLSERRQRPVELFPEPRLPPAWR
jgi:hypothetical protein